LSPILESLAAIASFVQPIVLNQRSHGPIEDEDAFGSGVLNGVHVLDFEAYSEGHEAHKGLVLIYPSPKTQGELAPGSRVAKTSKGPSLGLSG